MSYQPHSASAKAKPGWGTLPPHPALARHVTSYWWVRTEGRQSIKTLPDACVDVTFDLSQPKRPGAHISGLQRRPHTWELESGIWLFGARLLPPAAKILTGGSLGRLGPSWLPLAEFVGAEARALARDMAGAPDDAARAATLDAYFARRLLAVAVDERLSKALDLIFESGGRASIEAIAKQSGASARTLGRLFAEWVGLSPKRFARIVRFQAVLRRIDGKPDWARIAAELDYFDQSHLVRDMRELFGDIPTEAARSSLAQ